MQKEIESKDKIVLFSMSIEDLKNEISESILKKIAPLINNLPPIQSNMDLLTRKEVSKLFGVSLVTLNAWNKSGKITGYKINTRVRYKRSEIEKSLEKFN